MTIIMDLNFLRADEIVQLLCTRLRQERLVHEWTQAELARRAGVGVSTLSNLEAGRNTSVETLVRVAMVLGRTQELTALFTPQLQSLDDIQRLERAKQRQRIREKKHG